MENINAKLLSGIQHIGIPTIDLNKTVEFYQRLGFDIAYEATDVKFMEIGNLVIEFYVVEKVNDFYGAIDHIAIDVVDIEEVYREIRRMNYNTLDDEIHFLPFWKKVVRYFTIEGPNKERIEFSQFLS